MKRTILTSLVVLTISMAAQGQVADQGTKISIEPIDITGSYHCKGVAAEEAYSNVFTLMKTGQSYQFAWDDPVYGKFRGTGILVNSKPPVIGAFFVNITKPYLTGSVVYKILPNGSLAGAYVYKGKSEIGTETCTKDKVSETDQNPSAQ